MYLIGSIDVVCVLSSGTGINPLSVFLFFGVALINNIYTRNTLMIVFFWLVFEMELSMKLQTQQHPCSKNINSKFYPFQKILISYLMLLLLLFFIFEIVISQESNESNGVCKNYNDSPLLCKFCGSELTHRHNYKFYISELAKSTRNYRDVCPALEIQYFQHPDVFYISFIFVIDTC